MYRMRLRFSLRTLMLLVLLLASGFGLWWRWEPWVKVATFQAMTSAVSSPDGLRLLQWTDSEFQILDCDTLETIGAYKRGASRFHIRRLLGGNKVVTWVKAGATAQYSIADFSTGQEQLLEGVSGKLMHDTWAPDTGVAFGGKWLLVSDPPLIFDLETRTPVYRAANALSELSDISPEEKLNPPQRLREIIAKAGECRQFLELPPLIPPDVPFRMWFSKDGAIIGTCVDLDQTLQFWDAQSGRLLNASPIPRLEGKTAGLWHGPICVFSPDRKRVALTTLDKTEVYDIASGRLLTTLPGSVDEILAASCDHSGEHWIVRSHAAGGQAQLYGMKGRIGVESFSRTCATISPDGTRVLMQSYNDGLQMFNIAQGEYTQLSPKYCNPGLVTFLSNERFIAADNHASIYQQRRDDRLIGLLQLPELWLTALLTLLLLFSLRADYRALRQK